MADAAWTAGAQVRQSGFSRLLHFALALTIFSGGFVFIEPAPYEVAFAFLCCAVLIQGLRFPAILALPLACLSLWIFGGMLALAANGGASKPAIYMAISAYLALTPKQYSSGGKTVLVGISRYVANKRLRVVLIQGARAYVHRLKDPKTPKERWLWALIQRAGYGRAAVALANKNARTAWALLTQGASYDRDYGESLAAA